MPLNASLNKILDVKTGRGYIPGNYNQNNRLIKITYDETGQEYEFNLSKYEDGNNEIYLYENETEGYDMPAVVIRFNNARETEDFYREISEHLAAPEGVPPVLLEPRAYRLQEARV